MNRSLRVLAHTRGEAEHLAAVLALGMCTAVRTGAIDAEYACRTLFQPSLVARLRALGADPVLVEALADALEIGDVADLAPAALPAQLDKITATLTSFLRERPPRDDECSNWTTGQDRVRSV